MLYEVITTTVEPGGYGGKQISLLDDALFDFPWLYAVEVGYWQLDNREAARLREYLLRGGFLMLDDFHGDYQWQVFAESMHRVFPDRPILDIPESDEILRITSYNVCYTKLLRYRANSAFRNSTGDLQ